MCARPLACPLCSQPGFLTLDALRAGLVSVATRPIACPVCDEVLLGIDKLTIHLFGHSISPANAVVGGGSEPAKIIEVTTNNSGNIQAIVRNAQSQIPIQSWSVLEAGNKRSEENNRDNTAAGEIFIPINEIENFRNLTAVKDVNGVVPVNNNQNGGDLKAPSQVIFLQNVTTQPEVYTANLVTPTTTKHQQQQQPMAPIVYQTRSATARNAEAKSMNQPCMQKKNVNEHKAAEVVPVNGVSKNPSKNTLNSRQVHCSVQQPLNSWVDSANTEPSKSSKFPPSHTDRLAELVKNAQITPSPLGNFHKSFDCSKPPPEPPMKPSIKSTRILSASEKTERCNICGFHFPDRNILILHKQLVHMIQEKDSNRAPEDLMKNYPCHLCTKVFKMRGSLMVHMRVAHPGFNTSTAPKEPAPPKEPIQPTIETPKEKEAPANKEPETGFNCPTCGKHFKKEQHVTQHLKIHEGKQWECEICSKMFTTKYFLKKHKRLHSGEMPYKCAICDKTFTFQQSYHKHKLYHKDDKPHACTTCGRSFKELSTLHNHERIHTGEKPFACETCGKCFRQRVSYLVHRRIHTGAMPYKCTACGKNFRYKVSQRTHRCPLQASDAAAQQADSSDEVEASEMKETQDSSSQDEQSMDEPVTKEENQYVFILNEDGHHVLKRKIDVEKENAQNMNKSKPEQDKENTNGSSEFILDIWNEGTSNTMEYKESRSRTDDIISNALKHAKMWDEASDVNGDSRISDNSISKQLNNEFTSNLWNQAPPSDGSNKNNPDKASDFFSMVPSMPSLDNEIASPSAEMQHLRLNSPVGNQENSIEVNDCFPPMNNNVHAVQVEDNDLEKSFNEDNVNLATLQTINEESLKELLNSIADK